MPRIADCAWLLLLILPGAGCTPAPAATPLILPKAEFRFLDIDTGKPLAGVWVNFAWKGHPNERGVASCVRAVLARSDAEGWVRDTARDPHWQLRGGDFIFFKPGYEKFTYEMRDEDLRNNTVTTEVFFDRKYLQWFPAWANRLVELGYHWENNRFIKSMPRGDIQWASPDKGPRVYYLTRYRSTPNAGIGRFLGHVCDDSGAENIGLDTASIKVSDQARALTAARYFCGDQWKSVSGVDGSSLMHWIVQANWLLGSDPDINDWIGTTHPVVFEWLGSKSTPFDNEAREEYCRDLSEKSGRKILGYRLGDNYEE